ncbi:MAG: T9SS type A sorting domain-containing protein [Bacteroidales bacterium]|jgi:hypothetical protein|nr:T9SS type A sorting domain-containing protein [Bacteroidales bacterium]
MIIKKVLFFISLILTTITAVLAQSQAERLLNYQASEVYVKMSVASKNEINDLSRQFSVDDVKWNERTGQYDVRVWLANQDYAAFVERNLPFEMIEPNRATVSMATTVSQMSGWNRYPTYSTYTQMMQNFQTQFPNLCDIDTILAVTPAGDHSILVAHISNTLHQPSNKPSFLYSSTMHGDEVVGFYFMLHLIDYILNNSETDPIVQNIINNVDLWICPNENPDGTYKTNDNTINDSPTSTRANNNNIDLNRNYPGPGVENTANIQPEIQAMMDFSAQHHFVMSANFHGGAELANYPWDSWTSRQRSHADASWFEYICQNYVDSCYVIDASYMTDEGGVTEGGDWYVITGSRQDFMTYYRYCREITYEVGTDKVVNSSELPNYWNASKISLLRYIEECLYGFRGIVTDAVTHEPLEAKIFIQNHDQDNSEVYSHLPLGNYHRPVKAGTYSVTVTADCYQPQTFNVTATDQNVVIRDVQMVPLVSMPEVEDIYVLPGESGTLSATSNYDIYWYDSPISSNPIYIGNNFVTPALDESTTYWLQEITQDNDVLCQSDRGEVTVYVLDVPDTVYGELTLTGCTAIEYEGVTYSNSGDYTLVYPDAGPYSADSILQLHITIYPAYTTNIVDSISLGDSYIFGNDLIFGTTVGVYTYQTTLISANGCDSLLNLTLTVEGEAGVAENSNNQWQIFPNPVTESTTIVSKNGNPDFEIFVFDVYGRNIISKKSEGAAMELDMRGQARGVYFVRIIENKKETTTLKVVKN